jgi:hypothetical protein
LSAKKLVLKKQKLTKTPQKLPKTPQKLPPIIIPSKSHQNFYSNFNLLGNCKQNSQRETNAPETFASNCASPIKMSDRS